MGQFQKGEMETIYEAVTSRTVFLPDGTSVPALGQGTWRMGEDATQQKAEVRALQLGIELGMTLIDTAEMYGHGGAEKVVAQAISGRRDDLFLVSKVYPHHASLHQIKKACVQSLQRLQTDRIDLYLLHWRGSVPLDEVIEGMEQLVNEGKIVRWGVSNLDVADMEELLSYDAGDNCMVNQVLYHVGSRGIEYDLLPWQRKHNIPIMAYCPLAQAGMLRQELLHDETLRQIAEDHGVEPLQIALAWTMRTNDVIGIPKAVQPNHIVQNAQAAAIQLSKEEIAKIDAAFPPSNRKMPLDIV